MFATTTALAVTLTMAASPTPAVWERLGPRNIFDDDTNRGESGTLADAASPLGNANIIYTGGMNNGASSGVIKSTDMGVTWTQASNGLFDTRISGLFVYPGDTEGKHVLAGTPSGVWESTDGAASWSFVKETAAFGMAHSFRNGSVGGELRVLAATSAGIASVPMTGGEWSLIKSPRGDWHTPLSVADVGPDTVVVGCLGGQIVRGTIRNATGADWEFFPALECAVAAVDPNDKDHFLYSNATGWQTWESTDGGQTAHDTHHPTQCFYVTIDRQGWFYTGAEAGAYRSMDGGKSWQPYVVRMNSRAGFVDNRIPHDFQRLSVDFGDHGVAFPSDQGLFIRPLNTSTTFINACGNMSNNIAIKLAVSEGEGEGKNYLVLTIWDWAPIASWNSGKNWPATPCSYWDKINSCDGAPSAVGEGGSAYGLGRSNNVIMLHYHNVYWSSQGGKNLTRVLLPANSNAHSSELVYTRVAGSRSEPDGNVFTVMTMPLLEETSTAEAEEAGEEEKEEEEKGTSRRAATGKESEPSKDDSGADGDANKDKDKDDDDDGHLKYMSFGEKRDVRTGGPWLDDNSSGNTGRFVLRSADFGRTWNWTLFPKEISGATVLAVDPTNASIIFAVDPNAGIATSADRGDTWSPLLSGKGLTKVWLILALAA